MQLLTGKLEFPPVEEADVYGLLAIGGDLSVERLLLAYRSGIFPWYNEEDPICWWCPDPRFVLYPAELKVSKSMQTILNNPAFKFRVNTAFEKVMEACKTVLRNGQDGTWISLAIQKAYTELHRLGYAVSAETWKDGQLTGGLYGVRVGNIFFGESMFSKVSNASKYAFINYARQLQKEGVVLIDCQVYTQHLESLGARMIPRKEFTRLIKPA